MIHPNVATVGQYSSQAEAEEALQALEGAGFPFQRLFMVRAEFAPGLGESRRLLRKSIVAGAILGSLLGSWTGKAAVFIAPLMSLWGGGWIAKRGLATLEDALLLGALGGLASLLHPTHRIRTRGDPEPAAGPGAPFRIELRGTPDEAARARVILGGFQPQQVPA